MKLLRNDSVAFLFGALLLAEGCARGNRSKPGGPAAPPIGHATASSHAPSQQREAVPTDEFLGALDEMSKNASTVEVRWHGIGDGQNGAVTLADRAAITALCSSIRPEKVWRGFILTCSCQSGNPQLTFCLSDGKSSLLRVFHADYVVLDKRYTGEMGKTSRTELVQALAELGFDRSWHRPEGARQHAE